MADERVYGTGQDARSSKTVNEVSHIAGNLTKSRKKLEWLNVDLAIAVQHSARVDKVNGFAGEFAGVLMKDKRNGLVSGTVTVEDANRQVFLEAIRPHLEPDGTAPVAALVALVHPLALMMEVTLAVAETRIQTWEAARILDAEAAALAMRRTTLTQEIRNLMEYDVGE
jgi:hypothetical protein